MKGFRFSTAGFTAAGVEEKPETKGLFETGGSKIDKKNLLKEIPYKFEFKIWKIINLFSSPLMN